METLRSVDSREYERQQIAELADRVRDALIVYKKPSEPRTALQSVRRLDDVYDDFRDLCRLTDPMLIGVVYPIVRDEEDVDDVVEITHARAFGALDRFRGDAAYTTWVCRIGINVAYTLEEKRIRIARREALSGLDLEGYGGHVTMEIGDHVLRAAVSSAVNGLTEKLGSVARAILEGKTHKEVAEDHGIDEGAVRVRWYRARKELQRTLADNPAVTEYMQGVKL